MTSHIWIFYCFFFIYISKKFQLCFRTCFCGKIYPLDQFLKTILLKYKIYPLLICTNHHKNRLAFETIRSIFKMIISIFFQIFKNFDLIKTHYNNFTWFFYWFWFRRLYLFWNIYRNILAFDFDIYKILDKHKFQKYKIKFIILLLFFFSYKNKYV